MAETCVALPTCVLRVNLQCCDKCPMIIKKKLQKINGVYYIKIDTKNGLVLVSGFVDPPILKKAMEAIGKKANLLAYEKDPVQAKKKLQNFFKNIQRGQDKEHCSGEPNSCIKDMKEHANFTDSDSDDGDHDDDCSYSGKKTMKYAQESDKTFFMPNPDNGMESYVHAGDPGRYEQRVVDPVVSGLPPPGCAGPYSAKTSYGYSGYNSAIYGRPPLPQQLLPTLPMPLSNLYALYSGQIDPPIGNSLYHSFSDDNVRACSIM